MGVSLSSVSRSFGDRSLQAQRRTALTWVFAEPSGWARTRDPESELHGELFEEQAIVHGPKGSGFYIRGNLEVPVLNAADDLLFVVWVSLSGADFERAHALWNDPKRAEEPAYFGRLCNRIPGYPDTWHLDVYVHTQPVGRRPVIELQPADHPLVAEQKRGVPAQRAVQIANAFDSAADRRLDLRDATPPA
jgi:hypothetical protein